MAILFVGKAESVRKVTSSLPGPLFRIRIAEGLPLGAMDGISAVVMVDSEGLTPVFSINSNGEKKAIAKLCTQLNSL